MSGTWWSDSPGPQAISQRPFFSGSGSISESRRRDGKSQKHNQFRGQHRDFFSSKSLTRTCSEMTSHLHVMDLMGLCKWKPQFPRAPMWHPKRPSNPCTLITEELKGKISTEKESLCPIQGAFRSYSDVRRAFQLKMEPHTSLSDVSGTKSSQEVQMTVILKSYMESNNWCHKFYSNKLPFLLAWKAQLPLHPCLFLAWVCWPEWPLVQYSGPLLGAATLHLSPPVLLRSLQSWLPPAETSSPFEVSSRQSIKS